MKDNAPFFVAVFAILAIGLGGIIGTVAAQKVYPASCYPEQIVIMPLKTYKFDIVAPVKELIKEHGDDTRIMRHVDIDAGVVIYFTINATGDMVTSMHPIPINELSRSSNLYKRYAQ